MDVETIKRYSLIEIVLLAVLALGLLTASLIVKRRAAVLLSDPLPLAGSGLSVRMPINPGWEYTSAWQYEESEGSMALIGQYRGPGRGTIEAQWRYVLSTPPGSEQELLNQHAADTGVIMSNIEAVGQAHPMTYARMLSKTAETTKAFYLGVMRLDYNRSLELLVKSSGFNTFYEEIIFKSLAKSIKYQVPQQLAQGHVLMDSFLQSQSLSQEKAALPDEAFLIKDVLTNTPLGYYTATDSVYADGKQTLHRLHIRQVELKSVKLDSSLWFDPLGKKYRWKSDLIYPGLKEPQIYEIKTDKSGSLFIKRDVKETKVFPAGRFFLPEPLLPGFARWFLQSDSREVIVDVLGFQGQLVPVALKKISPNQAKVKFKNTDAAVRIQYLHTRDSYDELSFDASRNLLGKFEQQPGHRGHIWLAVATEDIRQLFQMDAQVSDDMIACTFHMVYN